MTMVISFACCRFLLYAASLAFVFSPTSVEAFTGHATLFTAVKPTGVSLLRARTTPSRGEWKLGTGVRLNALTRSQHIISLSASSEDPEASSTPEEAASKLTFRERWAEVFPKQEGDKLPFRQRLAKMGLACVLSYGFVSNINSVVTTAIAWFVFAKRTGLSPLAPGQWKSFLAVYAGFWVFNNFVRPARVALALGISPYFDKVILSFQNRLKVNKPVAIGITVFLANVVVTTVVLVLGVMAAAALSGTPIFVPRA